MVRAQTCCLVQWLLIIVLGAILAGLNLFSFTPTSTHDFLIRTERDAQLFQALEAAKEELGAEALDATVPSRTDESSSYNILFLAHATDKDLLFDEARLEEAYDLQARVAEDRGFRKVCQVTEEDPSRCMAVNSILALPDDVQSRYYANLSIPQIRPGDSKEDKEAVLSMYADADPENPASLAGLRNLFFDKDFGPDNLRSRYLRALFLGGTPLEGYRNENDRPDEQDADYTAELAPLSEEINLERFYESPAPAGVEAIVFGGRIMQSVFETATVTDLYWAGGTVLFVCGYLSLHSGSLFVAALGLAQTVGSMPVAFALYRLVGIRFFQTLHSLAIFVIIAVGADNLFLVYDAFSQAPVDKRASLRDPAVMYERVFFMWERAFKSASATSWSTAGAFFATANSTISPISSFGIFAAILVLSNFVLDLTLFPAVVVLHARHVLPYEQAVLRFLRHGCSSRSSPSAASAPAAAVGATATHKTASEQDVRGDAVEAALPSPTPQETPPSAESLKSVGRSESRMSLAHSRSSHVQVERPVEIFFRDVWTEWIVRFRFPILAVFTVLIALAAWRTSLITPLTEQERWFPDRHFLGRALNWLEEFPKTERDETVEVELTWGVLGIDRSGTDPFMPSEIGAPVWDEDFDASSPAAQLFLNDTCTLVEQLQDFRKLTSCWVRDYAAWLEGRNRTFPFVADAALGETDQRSAFEASLDDFCDDADTAGPLLRSQSRIGLDSDGHLRLTQITFLTDLLRFQPFDTNMPIYRRMEDFIAERNDSAPDGMQRGIQTAGMSWAWTRTERALVVNALQGIAISLAIAFAILIVATGNIWVAIFATLSIVGVVLWVLALEQLAGFEFGTAESVSAVIIIGFSVDYSVHIATHYIVSEAPSRVERLRDALTEMGVSIVAGAVTTAGGGAFLFGGIVIFFTKFAILICASLAFSLIFSVLFLPALLVVAGPRTDEGSIYSFDRLIARDPLFSFANPHTTKDDYVAPSEQDQAATPAPDASAATAASPQVA